MQPSFDHAATEHQQQQQQNFMHAAQQHTRPRAMTMSSSAASEQQDRNSHPAPAFDSSFGPPNSFGMSFNGTLPVPVPHFPASEFPLPPALPPPPPPPPPPYTEPHQPQASMDQLSSSHPVLAPVMLFAPLHLPYGPPFSAAFPSLPSAPFAPNMMSSPISIVPPTNQQQQWSPPPQQSLRKDSTSSIASQGPPAPFTAPLFMPQTAMSSSQTTSYPVPPSAPFIQPQETVYSPTEAPLSPGNGGNGLPKPCDVWNCFRPTFCQLSPCGCMICREHLGSVIRGAKLIEEEEEKKGGESESKGGPRDRVTQRKKIFTCISCRARSITAGPSTTNRERGKLSDKHGGLLGEFSIQYPHQQVHHEQPVIAMMPGAPFVHEPQSVDPDAPFRLNAPALNQHHQVPITNEYMYPVPLPPQPQSQSQQQQGEGGSNQPAHDITANFPSQASHAQGQMYEAYHFMPCAAGLDAPPPPSQMLLSMPPPPPPQPGPSASFPLYGTPTSYPIGPVTSQLATTPPKRGPFCHPSRRVPRPRAFSVPNTATADTSPPRPPHLTGANASHMGDKLLADTSSASKGNVRPSAASGIGAAWRKDSPAHRSADFTTAGKKWNESHSVTHEPFQLNKPLWPVIKIENIPFATTVADLEKWLPANCLPTADQVVHPIHLILHRGTGRTLPHCYVEIKSLQVANDVIIAMDRKLLGDRTVRLKWERRGELMRDLFSQEAYFSVPAATPAAAPLPPVPMRYTLPQNIVTEKDLDLLLSYCRTADDKALERPPERAFLNLASIITKFPWHDKDLFSESLRDSIADAAHAATTIAARKSRIKTPYRTVWLKLKAVSLDCVGFTSEQKRLIAAVEPEQSASVNATIRLAPTKRPSAPKADYEPVPLSPPFDRRGGPTPLTTDTKTAHAASPTQKAWPSTLLPSTPPTTPPRHTPQNLSSPPRQDLGARTKQVTTTRPSAAGV